jgi:hypothetical protein
MRDTYDSGAEAEADRAQQRALLTTLNGWDRALRRDECGAWRINGKHGSICSWGDSKSWVLFVAAYSRRHWTAIKERLPFCRVTQDADTEGCLRLHHLPTPEQAAVIRDVLGIRKRMQFAPYDLERRRASMTRLAQAKVSGPAASSVLGPTPEMEPILERPARSAAGGWK